MEKKKILIIDDEKRFGELLKLNFELTKNYVGLLATNGAEGVEMVKAHKPDLVLLDILMPGQNGLETLKQIKAIAPNLPVAMVTAVWREEEAKQCFEAGAYDYITKPVDFDYLKQAVLVKLL